MKKNVGTSDRIFRVLGAASSLMCSLLAPLPVAIRVAVFGTLSAYLLMTAVVGSCAGYALMGKSTCPTKART